MSHDGRRMLRHAIYSALVLLTCSLSLRAEPAPATPATNDASPPVADQAAAANVGASQDAAKKEAAEKPAVANEDIDKDAVAQPKYLLKFKFQPGQTVRYEVDYQMEMKTHFSGLTETVRNKSKSRRAYTVKEVTPDGEGNLQLVIEWVRMSAEFDNAKPIEFQSDDPKKHPRQFSNILDSIGKPQAAIRFSPAGRPREVTPLNGAPAAAPAPAALADASQESYLVPLPEQPIAVGDTWKERFTVVARDGSNLPEKILMQRTYKLLQVRDGLATIEFNTVILSPISDPSMSAQLIQRETAGKITFDIENGLIAARDVKVERTVFDPFGPQSSTRAASTYHEKLLPPATASREASAPTTSKQ